MYQEKVISLNKDRMLINRCKKAGLNVFNPQGRWNGYGYEKLPMAIRIKSKGDMRLFNKIKKEVDEKRKTVVARKSVSAIEKYVNKMIQKGIVEESEKEHIISLYYSNKTTKGTAWKCFAVWFREELGENNEPLIDDEQMETILLRMETAFKRHNYTEYDNIDKRKLTEEEVNCLRAYYNDYY